VEEAEGLWLVGLCMGHAADPAGVTWLFWGGKPKESLHPQHKEP